MELVETVELVKKDGKHFPFFKDIISFLADNNYSFHSISKPIVENKEQLLNTYRLRHLIVKDLGNAGEFYGYEDLLDNLEKSTHSYICISSFNNLSTGFLVFSDFDGIDLIGIVFIKK